MWSVTPGNRPGTSAGGVHTRKGVSKGAGTPGVQARPCQSSSRGYSRGVRRPTSVTRPLLTRMFACLRGSSEDDLAGRGHRSAQSTPRLGRTRVKDAKDGRQRFGSLGSMEMYRVQPRDPSHESERVHQILNKSWDVDCLEHVAGVASRGPSRERGERSRERGHDRRLDRVPGGLDRSWEAERYRGMEILACSMERDKERRATRTRAETDARGRNKDKERSKGKKKKKKERERSSGREQAYKDAQKWSRDRLEIRVDELNRQLIEEKQSGRREKLTVARLQRDIARHKSEGPLRESLMKELERERMLRIDAERRLQDMTLDSDHCKSRLQALQREFKKMEEMMKNVVRYKKKIDELKHEKTDMMVNYEHNLQKYRTQISNLEHENQILHAEVNKLESQCGSCQFCHQNLSYRVSNKLCLNNSHSDDGERSKMLLERLKMLEAEKTALVLENENQRQQYDKCLDEIANQVVQALMSQKSLREECAKLQRRVIDLEGQNRQLNMMFHQRIRFASDSVLQSLMGRKCATGCLGEAGGGGSNNSSATSLPLQHQLAVQGAGALAPGRNKADHTSPFSEFSLDSLPSFCSDYNEHIGSEEGAPGQPELSSPPPWLKEKLLKQAGSPTSSIASPVDQSLPSPQTVRVEGAQVSPSPSSSSNPICFNNSISSQSPDLSVGDCKSPVDGVRPKHEKDTENAMLQNANTPQSLEHRIETEFPASVNSSPRVKHIGVIYQHKHHSISPSEGSPVKNGATSGQQGAKRAYFPHSNGVLVLPSRRGDGGECPSTSPIPKVQASGHLGPVMLQDISPGKELLKLSDSFNEKYTINEHDGLPRIQNPPILPDLDTDSDTESRAMSQNFSSIASTVSLNELLERGLDGIHTPNEDNFSDIPADLDMSDQERDEDDMDPIDHALEMLGPSLGRAGIQLAESPGECDIHVPEGIADSMAEEPETVTEVKHCSCQTSPMMEDSCGFCCSDIQQDWRTESSQSLNSDLNRSSIDGHILSSTDTLQETVWPLDSFSKTAQRPSQLSVSSLHGRLKPPSPHSIASTSPTPTNHKAISPSRKGNDESITKCTKQKSKPPPVKPKPKRKPPTVSSEEKLQSVTPAASGTSGVNQISPVPASLSSTSPDSAMQQSFSSSGSDTTLGEKHGRHDDGYSSNSTASIANGEVRLLDIHQGYEHEVPQLTYQDVGTMCVSGDLSPEDRTNSVCSVISNTSTEKCPFGGVKNIKSFFDGKSNEINTSFEHSTVNSDTHNSGSALTMNGYGLNSPCSPGCLPYPSILGSRELIGSCSSCGGSQQASVVQSPVFSPSRTASPCLKKSHSDSCIYQSQHVMPHRSTSRCGRLPCLDKMSSRSSMFLSTSITLTCSTSSSNISSFFLREEFAHYLRTHKVRTRQHETKVTSPRAAREGRERRCGQAASKHELLPARKRAQNPHSHMCVGMALAGHRAPQTTTTRDVWLPRVGQPGSSSQPSVEWMEYQPKKMADLRMTGEGSESGYRSDERTETEGTSVESSPLPNRAESRSTKCHQQNNVKMSWLVWSSDSEGEESGGVSFTELWRTREAPAVSLDEWLPQSTQNKMLPSPQMTRKHEAKSSHTVTTLETLETGHSTVRNTDIRPAHMEQSVRHMREDICGPQCQKSTSFTAPHDENLMSSLGLPHEGSPSNGAEDFDQGYNHMCVNFQEELLQRAGGVEGDSEADSQSHQCEGQISPKSDASSLEENVTLPSSYQQEGECHQEAEQMDCRSDEGHDIARSADSDIWKNLTYDWSPVEDTSDCDRKLDVDLVIENDSGNDLDPENQVQAEEVDPEDEEISRRIRDLTATVTELQRSLSSLSSLDTEAGSGTSRMDEGNSPSSESEGTTLNLADPQVRAQALDDLFNSSSSDTDDLDPGDPSTSFLGRLHRKRRKRKESRQAPVRQVIRPRPTIDYHNFYIRYSSPERRALNTFSFLDDMSSATQSEDDTHHGRRGPQGHKDWPHKGNIRLGCNRISLRKPDSRVNAAIGSHSNKNSSHGNGVDRATKQRKSVTSLIRHKPPHRMVASLKEENRRENMLSVGPLSGVGDGTDSTGLLSSLRAGPPPAGGLLSGLGAGFTTGDVTPKHPHSAQNSVDELTIL